MRSKQTAKSGKATCGWKLRLKEKKGKHSKTTALLIAKTMKLQEVHH
jgi:hypothetical protein